MERFSFTSQVAFVPRGDQLDRVTVAPLTSPTSEGSPMQVAVFRFEPGGRLRGHPGHPQIFAILDGSGEVSGANGNDEPIEAGEAVFLHQGEEHGMKSAAGLTALIIEGERLDGPGRPTGCSFALNCGRPAISFASLRPNASSQYRRADASGGGIRPSPRQVAQRAGLPVRLCSNSIRLASWKPSPQGATLGVVSGSYPVAARARRMSDDVVSVGRLSDYPA